MNRIAATLVLCILCVSSQAMDRFAALSMIESGDNDQAIGPKGEITRYQIKPSTWRAYCHSAIHNPQSALAVAQAIMQDRTHKFSAGHRRQPSNLEWYLLWNCPADIDHPSRRELDRAHRFANLCCR